MAARLQSAAADGGSARTSGWRWWLRRPLDGFDSAWQRFAAFYHAQLEAALRHRARVVAGAVLLLALTVPVALSLDRSVLPNVDQGGFTARLELPRGTPLEATAEVATRLEQIFRADAAVDAVFSRIGKQAAVQGITEDRSGVHTAVLDVRLERGESTRRTLARLRPQLAGVAPGGVSIESGQATALGKLLGAGEADLAVRIRADDLDAALAYAQRVRSRLQQLPSLTNVRIGTELGQPEYLVEIDRERAASYGIDAREVADAVESFMRGRIATDFVAFDRKVPVLVRLPEAARRSLATMETLQLRGVPLRELVRVRESVGPVEIRRLDQSRLVPVFADATGRDIDGAVRAAQAAVRELPPPEGVRFELGGENEEMRRSFRELGLAFALALLLVYMILAAEFESLLHPFTVLLAVPMGLIGAVFALWVFGAGINSVSLIGMVILVGIVDNDAVVKIDFINQMRREGMSVRAAILEAGRARLRPIVMNSLTAMLAILPMMFGIGAGAGLQAPLAIAVFGGLLTATALTLVVIPVVYELFDELGVRLRSRLGRGTAATAAGEPRSERTTASPALVTATAEASVPSPASPARPLASE
jgi:HAE1 family hydrophobic/amphiphilic exporter-1